jgi:hypothetical protein
MQHAEHSAKDDRVFSLAAQVTTAGRTAAMSIDKGRHLSCDDMLLQAPLQGFALADRQANGFEPVVALLKMQDLAIGEYGAVIANDPKLKVNVHGRRHAGVFRKLQGYSRQTTRLHPPKLPTSHGFCCSRLPPAGSRQLRLAHTNSFSGSVLDGVAAHKDVGRDVKPFR